MVEIPAIVQAGSKIDDLAACFATRAEFIALGAAVFSADNPAQIIADANRQLDGLSAADTEE
jgi:thiamine-phosphate pyrophosphorylase